MYPDDGFQEIPKGFQKVGLDTSILVHLFHYKLDSSKFKREKLPARSAFYYAHKTKAEFIGVLMRKEGCSLPEASSAWEILEDSLNLQRIFWDRKIETEYIPRVKKINMESRLVIILN